jgi:SAM-dependent methyltransferase
VADADPNRLGIPIAHFSPEEKAKRAGSFGGAATHYERFRPGPPPAAVDWLLPSPVGTVVDLGAGTGALTRLLIDRADEVIAVEPDGRMRSVLREEVPGAHAVEGRGEAMPVPDASVDAVLASSSWHWMDPLPTLREVSRVLVPGGILGALWSGVDPEGPFLAQARSLLAQQSQTAAGVGAGAAANDQVGGLDGAEIGGFILGDGLLPTLVLEIPPGVPFGPPEHQVFAWDVALNADDLIRLLGTLSWIITMPEETRTRVVAEARRLLRELLGVEGEVTADVAFLAEVWRSRHSG